MQRQQIIRLRVEAASLGSTAVKAHLDGTKNGPQAIGKSRAGWATKTHMVAADARTAMSFALSPRQVGDAPAGRALLRHTPLSARYVLMGRAYEGDETRQLVLDLGMTPIVPLKRNRLPPWEYDHEVYKKRNEVERLFPSVQRVSATILPIR